MLAKALATGDGFRMINMPGAPHATHFPPGYPLLLAALWKLFPSFPDNIVVFKFVNALFLAATAIGTYRFSRSRLGLEPLGAFIAGGRWHDLVVVVLMITGVVLSEPLYMLLVIPTLFVAERAAEDGEPAHRPRLPARSLACWRSCALSACSCSRRRSSSCCFDGAGCRPRSLLGRNGVHRPVAALDLGVSGRDAGTVRREIRRVWPVAGRGISRRRTGRSRRAVLAKNADELFGFLGYITLPVVPVVAALGVVRHRARHARPSVPCRRWRRIPVTLLFLLALRRGDPHLAVRADALRARLVAAARGAVRRRRASRLALEARAMGRCTRCDSPASRRALVVTAGYGAYNLEAFDRNGGSTSRATPGRARSRSPNGWLGRRDPTTS